MLAFEERGKPEYTEENLFKQGENHQQTQPTCDAGSGDKARATLVGDECSHYCANLAPLRWIFYAFYEKRDENRQAKENR